MSASRRPWRLHLTTSISFPTSCCARCSRSAAFVGRRGIERRANVRIPVLGGLVIDLRAFPRATSGHLQFACRQVHPRLHPLVQSALWIANGTSDFHIRRPVATHPRLSQPGDADAQKFGGLVGSEQTVS